MASDMSEVTKSITFADPPTSSNFVSVKVPAWAINSDIMVSHTSVALDPVYISPRHNLMGIMRQMFGAQCHCGKDSANHGKVIPQSLYTIVDRVHTISAGHVGEFTSYQTELKTHPV